MRRFLPIVLIGFMACGCATSSTKKGQNNAQLVNELQGEIRLMKERQKEYEATQQEILTSLKEHQQSQRQIVKTTKEILRLLSELYHR